MKCLIGLSIFVIIAVLQFVDGRRYRDISVISVANNLSNKILQSQSATISEAMASSVELSLTNCQTQFKWDRWNCPTTDFVSKRSSPIFDRESAYVQAITVAALIYTVTKNCSRGELVDCGCAIYSNIESTNVRSGCSDQIAYGEQVVQEFFAKPEQMKLDAQGFAEVHNNRAGRLAVRRSLRKHCRCHGLSGSCSMQTCWMSMNTFPEIAADLKQLYDRAVLISVDNKGNFKTDMRRESLVYVLDSPNYCLPSAVNDWPGMNGRQCSRRKGNGTTAAERKSCRQLCRSCGLRVRRQTVIQSRRCNCKFHWCCDVKCDVCTDKIEEFYCD